MGKASKLRIREVTDIPLREVSGLALDNGLLLAVGDRDPVLFTAPMEPFPLRWEGTDLAGLDLPDGGVQFEAVEPTGDRTVLILQEQPARVLHIDWAAGTLLGALSLEIPDTHRLRQAWLGDRSSRGESLILTERGHLLVVKEKDPAAILEFGPPGEDPVGWCRARPATPPAPGDAALTVLATWWLSDRLAILLPDVSDATVGPDGCLYLLSDQSGVIVRLPDQLDAAGGTLDAIASWRIGGHPENPEGLVILPDGTVLIGLDTKAPKGNLLRLDRLELDAADTS